MKLIVLKNNLRDGLNAVEKTASENTNLPILKNVLIKTFNNKIQLTATNLELAVIKLISGKIIEEGSITIPLTALSHITQNINSEKINLEVENNVLLFKTDNYQANLQGLPEEEFPIIPKIENTNHYLQLNSEILKEGILKIINAVQFSEIRPELGGLLLDFQITNLKLTGTDSFRLAEKTVTESNFKSNFQRGFKVIIPLKTAQELLRTLNNEMITIFIDPNQILFKNEDLEIISRLVNGSYPDYEPIIPKSLATEMILEREHLLNAAKLVSNFSAKTNEVRIKLKDDKKFLEVYSANQYLGESRYLIPVKAKGDNFETSFNWRYLVDGLKNFNEKEIIFGVNGDNRPAILKSPGDFSYFYILMPIKA